MALARVVTFEDVDADELARQTAEMESGNRPNGLPASEIVVLHDKEAGKSIVVLFF